MTSDINNKAMPTEEYMRQLFEAGVRKYCETAPYDADGQLRRPRNGTYQVPAIYAAFEGFKDGYRACLSVPTDEARREALKAFKRCARDLDNAGMHDIDIKTICACLSVPTAMVLPDHIIKWLTVLSISGNTEDKENSSVCLALLQQKDKNSD